MACPLYRRGNRLGEDRDPRSLHFGEAGWGWAVMLGTLGAQGAPAPPSGLTLQLCGPFSPALPPVPGCLHSSRASSIVRSAFILGGCPLCWPGLTPLWTYVKWDRGRFQGLPGSPWPPLAPALNNGLSTGPPAPGARPGTAVSPDIFRALGRGNHCGRPWGILATCAAPPWPSWSTLEPWGLGPALQACKPGPGLQQCLEASCPVPRPLGTQVQAARPEELGALGTPAASSTSSQLTRAPHLTGTG